MPAPEHSIVFWLCLGAYTIIDAAGTYFAVRWSKGELSARYFFLALIFYAACSVCWLVSCRYEDVGRGSVLYPLIAMAVGVGCTLWVGTEKLTGLNWVGVGFAAAAILLVQHRG